MITSKNEKDDDINELSYASLSIADSAGSGSLSSGLSMADPSVNGSTRTSNPLPLDVLPDESMKQAKQNEISTQPNENRRLTSNRTVEGASSLMTLFQTNQQEKTFEKNDYDVLHVDDEDDYGFAVEPVLERRMTEKVSNSAVVSRDVSEIDLNNICNGEDEKVYKGDFTETDYLLKAMKPNIAMNGFQYTNGAKAESDKIDHGQTSNNAGCVISWESIKETISGSVMFILFHILFCLAQASAIHRPHSAKPILGQMTRMSALGPIVAGPLYVYVLGDQFPALYPTIDAFPAPFLVEMANIVDDMLYSNGMEDDEDLFMTTFCVLSGLGLIFTGLFLFIGTKFKLADLGAFLPYPVLAGFFSTVGFLGWTLAFSVDTGKNIGEVVRDGSWDETKRCLLHHIPSVIVGISISVFVSGPRKSWTPLFVLGTIPIVFMIMHFTGTSLDDARALGWFWKKEEFESVSDTSFINFHREEGFSWNPPLPFGVCAGVLRGKVYLPAVLKGLPVSLAMGLMYLLRCSLHVPALAKNSENLLKWAEDQKVQIRASHTQSDAKSVRVDSGSEGPRMRSFSEESCYNHDEDEIESNLVATANKTQNYSVADTYLWYAKFLSFAGLAGGSATIPSMGASITLFKIGARGKSPQYGSIVLLVFFYLNKFELVGYFPRIVFSTLLFISSMDLLNNWFVLSYNKTADKGEWLIVPILSLFAFVVGVLPAVAFGMALSTMIFVGSFYKSGVVKFIATGMTVHSTTERNVDDAEWLDQNGDLIQVLVLQNYLFFGNANSVKNYVASMFSTRESAYEHSTPSPKYLIIDFSLVTGMDTSSVEIFSDIVTLCYERKCQVFLAALSPSLSYVMKRGGVKPSSDVMSKYSILRLPPTLESALMKAEDGLLKFVLKTEEREMIHVHERSRNAVNDGFLHALTLIDQKHGTAIASKLNDLRPFTSVVNLAAGESLFHNPDGSENDRELGLFFIEHGIIRVERDAFATNTRTGNTLRSIDSSDAPTGLTSFGSLTNLKAAWVSKLNNDDKRNVRIARFGSGW